jgi:ribonuclease Z
MMAHLDQAFDFDIRIRLYDDRLPPQGVVVLAEDINEGVVYEHNSLKVTAIEVDHFPVQPAFGYRIDFAGRSVVISGDTRFSEHLISYAQGVDVLLHEVLVADLVQTRSSINPEAMDRVIAHHTTAEQAGELFKRVQPRLAVFTHIIPVTATAQDIIPPARKTYSGPLEVGEDLMVINIGDQVTVQRNSG